MHAYLARLDKRTFLLLLGGLLLLLVALLASYWVWPQFKLMRSEWNTRDLLQEAAANGQVLEGELASLTEQVDTLKHKVHGDLANLPVQQMEAYIIGRLQDMAWRHQVQLGGIKPGAGQRVKIFKEMRFDVEVSGSYFNLIAWLRELGQELGFVVVKEFELKPMANVNRGSRDAAAVPRLLLLLTIVSYRIAVS